MDLGWKVEKIKRKQSEFYSVYHFSVNLCTEVLGLGAEATDVCVNQGTGILHGSAAPLWVSI